MLIIYLFFLSGCKSTSSDKREPLLFIDELAYKKGYKCQSYKVTPETSYRFFVVIDDHKGNIKTYRLNTFDKTEMKKKRDFFDMHYFSFLKNRSSFNRFTTFKNTKEYFYTSDITSGGISSFEHGTTIMIAVKRDEISRMPVFFLSFEEKVFKDLLAFDSLRIPNYDQFSLFLSSKDNFYKATLNSNNGDKKSMYFYACPII